ncbi:MAG: type II toxin-antitoxin system Phd/YefM family antitoxin [Desulfobacterales bacterium]|nr:type II toxin-antitoxin system Phd/YefM family antitoxin [Desulfobacterales bacterium]
MRTINIHEAKTHLSRLVEEAAKGNEFIIAKSGRPMVKVTPLSEKASEELERIGFMAGEMAVPKDFDSMGADEVVVLFEGRVS